MKLLLITVALGLLFIQFYCQHDNFVYDIFIRDVQYPVIIGQICFWIIVRLLLEAQKQKMFLCLYCILTNEQI